MANSWLGTERRPIAAATAVRPTSIGMPAATSAPKTTTRTPSVTGSAVYSARVKSSPIVSSNAFWPLAAPLLHACDGLEDRLHERRRLLVGVRDLELDERGLPVLRDEGGAARVER